MIVQNLLTVALVRAPLAPIAAYLLKTKYNFINYFYFSTRFL